METVAKKKPRPRRSFTPEFKAEIVERCQAGDRTIAQVARDFDLSRDGGAEVGGPGGRRRGPAGGPDQRRAGGTGPAATGEPPAAGRRGHAQAGNGFLRSGDPVKMDPFIEAEEAAGHSTSAAVTCSRSPAPPTTSARSRFPRPGPSPTRSCSRRSARSTTTPTAPTGGRGCTGSCSSGTWSAGGDGCVG